MKKKFLIIIDGLNGAGKSTVASILYQKLPRTALLSYDKIKRCVSDFVSNEEDCALANYVVRAMAKEYLDHDINVIIESYIPTKRIAQRYTSLTQRKDVRLFYYQLEAPVELRMKRISKRPLPEGAKKKISLERLQINDAVYFKNKVTKAKIIHTHDKKPEAIARFIVNDLK